MYSVPFLVLVDVLLKVAYLSQKSGGFSSEMKAIALDYVLAKSQKPISFSLDNLSHRMFEHSPNANKIISLSLCHLIEACYPVGSIQTVEVLTGGEWNQVFRLDCEQGNFVLRISHPTNTLESLNYELQFLQFIHQHIPQVPPPLVNCHKLLYLQHDGSLITLFPFMPGRMLDIKNEAECMLAARMLARLQRVGLTYPHQSPRPDKPQFCELNWDHNHWWQWDKVENLLFQQSEVFLRALQSEKERSIAEQIFAKRKFIAEERKFLRDWVRALRNARRSPLTAVTHCDYWRNNILVEDDRISAVVDWDGCRSEWLFYALGRATWDFCKDLQQQQLDQSKATKFLRAYQMAGGSVPTAEFTRLVPVMRCVCLIEVLIGLQEAQERGLHEHELLRLRALQNLQNISLSGA